MARSNDSRKGLGFWANGFQFFHKYGIIILGVLVILAPFLLNNLGSLALKAAREGWSSAPFLEGLQNFLPNVPLLIQIIIYALYGMAFNITLGYGGVLSLGHCAFFGVGGYTAGLLFRWLQRAEDVPQALVSFFLIAPVEFSMIATVITTFLVALLIGYLGMRKLGVYFAMLTLALSQVFYYAAQTFDDFTGGTDGLGGLDNLNLGILGGKRIGVIDVMSTYWFIIAVTFISVYLVWQVLRSPYGRVLNAVRENEERARTCGYDTHRVKLVAFIVSGVFSGIAGALAIIYGESVPIENIHWSNSGQVVIITLFGGAGTFLGPAIGSFIYWYLRQLMSTQFVNWWVGFEYWEAWVGGLFIVIVLFLPDGILGTLKRRTGDYIRKRRLIAEGKLSVAKVKETPAA
ncbi:MAG: branched-chain amino acid ABC transporter permease [Nitrospinota bacterium]